MRLCVAALALFVLPGCSAILKFDQCNHDEDCVLGRTEDKPLYCTSDHICVDDVPSERLCELSPASSTDKDAVAIAGLFRRTGPNGVTDTDIEQAVVLAVEEINTLDVTRPLRLVLCDTANEPEQAKKALIAATDRFGAVAAVGPTSSGEVVALAASPDLVVQKHDFLIVSCSATSPNVTLLADDNLIWRTAASDNLQSRVLAQLVAQSGKKRVASAYVNSPYGIGLNGEFGAALSDIAGVSFVPKGFSEGTPGADVVSWLAEQTPEIALIVADSDAPTWVAALNDGGPALMDTQFLLTDGSKADALFSLGPDEAVLARIRGTGPGTPKDGLSRQAYDVFRAAYMVRWGVDPNRTAFVANAYDALYAIAIAMGTIPPEAAVSGHALSVGMQRLSDGNPIRVGGVQFANGYQQLANGQTVNLDGVSGPIDFDPATGDILTAPIEVWDVYYPDMTGAPPDAGTGGPTFRTVDNITP
jgi:branched-chain amino acid transport system substrate-binding protein